MYTNRFVNTNNTKKFHFEYSISALNDNCPYFPKGSYDLLDAKAFGLFLSYTKGAPPKLIWYEDNTKKSIRAVPLIRVLASLEPQCNIVWRETKTGKIRNETKANYRDLNELNNMDYDVFVDDVLVYQTHLGQGGVYALIIANYEEAFITNLIEVTPPNSISIFWLIPQYVVLTLAEVMFSLTGLEFSYTQSPNSMKSVMQACWLLTISFGNVIVVIIAEAKFFQSQASECFLFSGLMFVDMIIFMWLAYNYKPYRPTNDGDYSYNLKVLDRTIRNETQQKHSTKRDNLW